MSDPRRSFEQHEVIEHVVTETRRPAPGVVGIGGTPNRRETGYRETTETITFGGSGGGGSGGSRGSPTSLRQISGITPPRVASFQQLTGYTPPQIGKYGGYDVVEVHTPGGGARIVETHGGEEFNQSPPAEIPPPRPVDSPARRPGITSILKSGLLGSFRSSSRSSSKREQAQAAAASTPIFTVPHLSRSDSWRHVTGSADDAGAKTFRASFSSDQTIFTQPMFLESHAPAKCASVALKFTSIIATVCLLLKTPSRRMTTASSGSITRQGSYKRMQQKQESDSLENAQVYAPRSDTSLVSAAQRDSRVASSHGGHPHGDSFSEKAQYWYRKVQDRFRNTPYSRQFLANLLLLGLFAILLLILLIIILRALFGSYATRALILYPPACEECRRRNPDALTTQPPSRLYVHHNSRAQAHFELIGAAPFKSNSFTAIDFDTGFVAYADHALSDPNGRHSTCFLMALDRSAIPDMDALDNALDNVHTEIYSQFGWQEYWQFSAEPIDATAAQRRFTERIRDCEGARWYLLKHTVYTRDGSCGDCYDFCLPDYGVQRLMKYNDEMTIGIRRLNCFRLYIPEWAQYSVNADASGGHWQYPRSGGNGRLPPQNQGNVGNWPGQ